MVSYKLLENGVFEHSYRISEGSYRLFSVLYVDKVLINKYLRFSYKISVFFKSERLY